MIRRWLVGAGLALFPCISGAQAYYPYSTTSPTQYVPCTNSTSTDDALLAKAFANGGGIELQGSCTISQALTVISGTTFNGNGYTVTGVGNIGAFVAANNASGIVIENTILSFPSAGAAHHLIEFPSGNSDLSVVNNKGTGGGDFVAYIGSTNTYTAGNKAYNNTNSCYDHWFGAGNNMDIGNFCSMSAAGSAEYGILWTGFDTGGNPTTTVHYSAIGNIIVMNMPANVNNIGIWLEGRSTCGGGADDYDIVADNQIIFASTVFGVGIRANGCVNNAVIHDNIITTDGVTSTTNHQAIEVLTPATNINVHDNLVWNWKNTGAGIFSNTGTGGSLQFNHCYGTCTSSTTAIDNIGSNLTLQQIGDDTGTGKIATNGNAYPQSYILQQWGVPAALPPSGFFQNNGVYIVGQAPAGAATLSVSATSGSVTATFSAATLLGTASDVTRVITICDGNCTTTTASTYKYCTITAQSSTTVATCTLSGTLSGTGPFANASVWISGANTGTASYGAVFTAVYNPIYLSFPANVISASTVGGVYYSQCVSTTVCTVFNNAISGSVPVQISSPTAFSTTGTGAFAQTTGSLTLISFTLPANSLGPNGSATILLPSIVPNNANNRQAIIFLGGVQIADLTHGANYWGSIKRTFRNAGVTNAQYMFSASSSGASEDTVNSSIPAALSLDTTTSLTFSLRAFTNTATDYVILTGGSVTIQYAP